MQEIIPFDYQGKTIRVLRDNADEPWWVAKDICGTLRIADVTSTLRGLDDDEKTTLHITRSHIEQGLSDNSPGTDLNIINEAGLYSLILRSRKPEAKEFKRWVTHEVLPAIRKTGAYTTSQVEHPIKETPVLKLPKSVTWNKIATSHRAFLKIAEDMGFTGEDRLKLAQQAVFRAYQVDVRNLFKPEVEKAEKVMIEITQEPIQITMREPKKRSMIITKTSQNDTENAKMETEVPMDAHLRVTDLGRLLGGIQARKMNQILEQEGYQMALREKDGIEWCVTQKGSPFAIKKYVPKSNGIGGSVLQTFWKASIIKELQKVMVQSNII